MGIYVGDTEIKGIYLGDTPVKEVYLGDTKVRPTFKPKTFTISRTEKSDMSSGWTYSDDATGLTAGDGAFDDFFGYSAVLLNTSGVETAEMKQSGGVFTGAMTTLGNITSGDNVMIKFPVRGIKMSKSGSVVTLSITDELGKSGYQYYAFQNTGDVDTNTENTTTQPLYLGAYFSSNSNNVYKSLSGKQPVYGTLSNKIDYSAANGAGYTIMGWYQRCLINAYYMMKYGNPNGKSVVGISKTDYNYRPNSGGTNSQVKATYGTSDNTKYIKLFGLEDWWGDPGQVLGGIWIDGSKNIQVALHDFKSSISSQSHYKKIGTVTTSGYGTISSILGNNKGMFFANGLTSSSGNTFNQYYSAYSNTGGNSVFQTAGGLNNPGNRVGPFYLMNDSYAAGNYGSYGSRLMYL